MKKLFLLVFCVLSFPIFLYSAPLENVEQTIYQPDGAVIYCFASGDEFYNWLHDAAGYTIIRDPESGYYCYAKKIGSLLIPSKYRVGEVDPAKVGLVPHAVSPSFNQRKISDREPIGLKKRKASGAKTDKLQISRTGTINNIVVFIKFADDPDVTVPISYFNSMFNGADTSSLRDYFQQVSRNSLTVNTYFYPAANGTSVVCWQDTAARNYYRPYSAVNPIGYSNDNESGVREHALLARVVAGISSSIPENIDFDSDNDGYIDNICFVVAGNAEGWSDLLWPHQWSLYSQNVYIGDSRVMTYNFQMMDYLTNNRKVGVLCHEFFHSLGAPDLYHYSQDSLNPVGRWDIMASTMNPPQFPSVYTRWHYLGWTSGLTIINTPGRYTLRKSTAASKTMCEIDIGDETSESIFLEYRKKEGRYENSLPGNAGLIASRIVPYLEGNADGPPDEIYVFRPGGSISANGSPNLAGLSTASGRTSAGVGTDIGFFDSRGKTIGVLIDSVVEAGDSVSFNVKYELITPTLLLPLNGEADVVQSPMFEWKAQKVTANSHLQISTDTNFSNIVVDTVLAGNKCTINSALNSGTKYFWRIWEENSGDTTGAAVASFSVIPSNKIKYISESFEGGSFPPSGWRSNFFYGGYIWEKVSAGAFPVCRVPHGISMITYYSYRAPSGYQGILWAPSLNLRRTNGNTVSFRMFRDSNLYSDRVLVYANSVESANNAVILGTIHRSCSLSPTSNSGWFKYTFEIPDSLADSACHIGIAAISNYGYNVCVDDIEIQGNIIPPPAVSLISPADDSVLNVYSGFLHYSAEIAADSFEIQVSSVPAFSGNVIRSFSTSDSAAFSKLVCGEDYYWRVRAYNANGIGEWSSVSHFRIASAEMNVTGNLLFSGIYNGSKQKWISITAVLLKGISLYSSTVCARQAVLLDSNGHFEFTFAGINHGAYRLAFVLPGYLPVVTNSSINVNCGENAASYDFPNNSSPAVSSSVIFKSINGKYCVRCGDLNNDGTISASDLNLLKENLGLSTSFQY